MQLKDLSAPFDERDIEWRIGQSGKKNDRIWAKCLAYITSRAVMDRLDSVCGVENWRNEFAKAPEGGVLCGISIRMASGEWITKWDGAENTDIEGVKGGLSGAMKRAAVQWGIGRYLYDLEEGWAKVHENGTHSAKLKDGTYFNWDPPALPKWALPTIVRTESGETVNTQTGEVSLNVNELPAPPERIALLRSILLRVEPLKHKAGSDDKRKLTHADKLVVQEGVAASKVEKAIEYAAKIYGQLMHPLDPVRQAEAEDAALLPFNDGD